MMMVNSINPYQGLQNAIRPGGSNTSRVETGLVLSRGRSNPVPMPAMDSRQAQAQGIRERVNALQNKWDLNHVQYPPFFPIATFQRVDLIGEVRSIQQDVERSSLNSELKQAVAGEKLKDDATDRQIANVLDKIRSLRDTLSRELAVSKKDIRPGAILKLEA
jgi:hypothetical protein